MIAHDENEQTALIAEYQDKIQESYEIFRTNMEIIYNYGVDEQVMKAEFVRECMNRLGLT